jgi:hypothetical protein
LRNDHRKTRNLPFMVQHLLPGSQDRSCSDRPEYHQL